MSGRNYATRMSCFSLISSIETDLRSVLALQAYDDYLKILPEDVASTAKARYLDHKKEVFSKESDLSELLEFIDFYDLSKILNKIATVQTAFSDSELKSITTGLEKLSKCRNRVCHSRPLEPNDFVSLLDFTQELVETGDRLDWKNINEAIRNLDNPSFALSLSIPDFWKPNKKAIYNNLPLPEFDDTGFMGRDNDRKSINKLLNSNTSVISIVGEGGIGKTALAQRCLYDILELCEDEKNDSAPYDIIVWVTLKTNRLTVGGVEQIQNAISSSSGLFHNITSALGAGAPTDIAGALSEISEYMSEFKTLLCIDNMETINSSEVRDFLANIPHHSRVLITTRIGLGEIEYRYKLDKLDDKPSIDLMRNMSRLLNIDSLSKKKSEQLKHLCKRLHNNPLLIKWYVLAVASGHAPADLINKEGLSFKDALRFCFENLYDKLGEVESKVISIIACLRKPVSAVELRFFLDGEAEIKIEEALHQLHNSSMLQSSTDANDGEGRLYSLTGVAEEYMSSVRPVSEDIYQMVKSKRKELQKILDSTNIMQHHYNYDLNTISWSTRDEKICAIYLKKALSAARNQNFKDAEELIVQAKNIMPEFSECYRVQGYLLKDSSPYKAEIELEKAIAFNPGSAIARYAYAQFLISEEDFSRARVQIDKSLEIDAGDIALLTCKAWILTLSGDYKPAAELYEYLIPEQHTRNRKFRISTYDQASNCYRRMTSQSFRDNDYAAASISIGRRIGILSHAIQSGDFDHGTVKRLCQALVDAEAYYVKTNDASMSIEILGLVDSTFSDFSAKSLQALQIGLSMYLQVCNSPNSFKAKDLLQRAAPAAPVSAGVRNSGKVYNVVHSPTGVNYGFIRSVQGESLFFPRKELNPRNMLDEEYLGVEVTFLEEYSEKGTCARDITKS